MIEFFIILILPVTLIIWARLCYMLIDGGWQQTHSCNECGYTSRWRHCFNPCQGCGSMSSTKSGVGRPKFFGGYEYLYKTDESKTNQK